MEALFATSVSLVALAHARRCAHVAHPHLASVLRLPIPRARLRLRAIWFTARSALFVGIPPVVGISSLDPGALTMDRLDPGAPMSERYESGAELVEGAIQMSVRDGTEEQICKGMVQRSCSFH